MYCLWKRVLIQCLAIRLYLLKLSQAVTGPCMWVWKSLLNIFCSNWSRWPLANDNLPRILQLCHHGCQVSYKGTRWYAYFHSRQTLTNVSLLVTQKKLKLMFTLGNCKASTFNLKMIGTASIWIMWWVSLIHGKSIARSNCCWCHLLNWTSTNQGWQGNCLTSFCVIHLHCALCTNEFTFSDLVSYWWWW